MKNAKTSHSTKTADRPTRAGGCRIAAGLVAVSGATVAGTGIATAAPSASNGTSVTMTLVNNSSELLQLHDMSTSGGAHVTGRLPVYLRPGATASQTVTNDASEMFVQINYIADNPRQTRVGYGAHASGSRIDTAGTGVSDGSFTLQVKQSPSRPTVVEYDLA